MAFDWDLVLGRLTIKKEEIGLFYIFTNPKKKVTRIRMFI